MKFFLCIFAIYSICICKFYIVCLSHGPRVHRYVSTEASKSAILLLLTPQQADSQTFPSLNINICLSLGPRVVRYVSTGVSRSAILLLSTPQQPDSLDINKVII
jgi:hypothetical protein